MKSTILATGLVTLLSSATAMACPSGTTPANTTWRSQEVCVLKGRYVSDLVLTNNYAYFLDGGVFIGNDNKQNAVLTIQPGTQIAGATGADFLVVTRGSEIQAKGTHTQPIVFTTSNENPTRGSWGGLVINGNAPINCSNPGSTFCEAEGEGSTGLYGGTDAQDSSGALKYVRVEYAGYEITPENELNGIAFQGVGAGTLVDYIQVHMNSDDGVEFFGGTVNVKHVLLTANKDDSLDWTSGWTGKGQYIFVEQAADEGNNGIEADSLKSPMDASPRSNPTLANVTLIGSETARKGGAGILLRRGTGLKLYNTVITGFKAGGLDVDDAETFRNGQDYTDGLPGIHIANTIFDNAKNFINDEGEIDLAEWVLELMDLDVLFGLEANREEKVVLQNNAVTTDMLAVLPEDADFFFDEVDFIGAVDPEGDDWTQGWSIR